MLVVADQSREDADRARRAEVTMEQIHGLSLKFDSTTWRSLGSEHGKAPQQAIADGVETYRTMALRLRALRRLSVRRQAIQRIEDALGATYAVGIRTIVVSRTDPAASRRIATGAFNAALERLNHVVVAAASH